MMLVLCIVEINQTINDHQGISQCIQIHPSILGEVIKILQNYMAQLPSNTSQKAVYLTEEDEKKIQARYLKGVSLKDLALQFDQTESLIKLVLESQGIVLALNHPPKEYSRRFKRRKK